MIKEDEIVDIIDKVDASHVAIDLIE